MSYRRILSALAPKQLWNDNRKIRFLIVGGWNTVFGYLCFYVLYHLTADHLHYLVITALAHFINIIQAYVMHRGLVFRSAARIVDEFLRFNASYVATFVFGLLAMFLLVDGFGISPLLAQAIVILINVVLSYVLHSRVSFRPPADPPGPRP